MICEPAAQSNRKGISSFLLLIVGLMVVAGLLYMAVTQTMLQAVEGEVSGNWGSHVVQARLGKGTEGLLKQAAIHMSKLLGGQSIGGFPGFEPPDDDERYKDKIHNQSYNGEEVNHWIKEINNFLRQIIKKNPDMTLEEILQEAGLQQGDIESFIRGLRNVHIIAAGNEGVGVTSATVKALEELMEILGVAPWV